MAVFALGFPRLRTAPQSSPEVAWAIFNNHNHRSSGSMRNGLAATAYIGRKGGQDLLGFVLEVGKYPAA